MSNSCKFYKQKKQVSYDSGTTWQDVYVEGQLVTQKGELYDSQSVDCGFIPPPQYRWVIDPDINVNYGEDWTCAAEVYQVSYDGGQNWQNVIQNGYLVIRNTDNCSGCTCTNASDTMGVNCTLVTPNYRYYVGISDRISEAQILREFSQPLSSLTEAYFYGCDMKFESGALTAATNLKIVDIGCDVEKIESNVFNSNSLEKITIRAKTPPTITSSSFNNSHNCPIYVYSGFINNYRSQWPSVSSRLYSIN